MESSLPTRSRWVVLAFFGGLGCAAGATSPPHAPTAASEPARPPSSAATAESNAERSNVAIAANIRSACGISDDEAFFAYDSATLRPGDASVLRRLADCFTSGPLKNREMRLVGHADPRGDGEYNYLLGQRRADSVKGAIVSSGMGRDHVATVSRGEDEARGVDEAGWSKDRRVDILLGK